MKVEEAGQFDSEEGRGVFAALRAFLEGLEDSRIWEISIDEMEGIDEGHKRLVIVVDIKPCPTPSKPG